MAGRIKTLLFPNVKFIFMASSYFFFFLIVSPLTESQFLMTIDFSRFCNIQYVLRSFLSPKSSLTHICVCISPTNCVTTCDVKSFS